MKARENYTRLIAVALVLTLGILVAFQIYLLREPERIQTVLAADQSRRVERGKVLFAANCTECHGANGEGNDGPSLNNKKFLKNTHDDVIFNLISSGVPGTAMPAWSQLHGGPFTDEQVRDLVGLVRNWETTATDLVKPTRAPNAAQGAVIYSSTCYACHGVNGEGTKTAPALNSKEFLAKFDNAWLRQTIAQGRPGKGMPTWGKVLSPAQIDDVVAYIRNWESSAPLGSGATPTPMAMAPETPMAMATGMPAMGTMQPNCGKPNCSAPGAAITQNLKGDPENGAKLFAANCAKCHGEQGTGDVLNSGSAEGTIPALNPVDEEMGKDDPAVFARTLDFFIEHGSLPEGPDPKNKMPAFGDENKLTPQDIADVIAYVMMLNK